jgi:hypothetical protein
VLFDCHKRYYDFCALHRGSKFTVDSSPFTMSTDPQDIMGDVNMVPDSQCPEQPLLALALTGTQKRQRPGTPPVSDVDEESGAQYPGYNFEHLLATARYKNLGKKSRALGAAAARAFRKALQKRAALKRFELNLKQYKELGTYPNFIKQAVAGVQLQDAPAEIQQEADALIASARKALLGLAIRAAESAEVAATAAATSELAAGKASINSLFAEYPAKFADALAELKYVQLAEYDLACEEADQEVTAATNQHEQTRDKRAAAADATAAERGPISLEQQVKLLVAREVKAQLPKLRIEPPPSKAAPSKAAPPKAAPGKAPPAKLKSGETTPRAPPRQQQQQRPQQRSSSAPPASRGKNKQQRKAGGRPA